MSETATAAPSAPSAASSPAGSQAQSVQGAQDAGGKVQGAKGQESQAPLTEEELEEIKVGSASAKLPKAFAKVVKDLERGFHSKAQEAAQTRKQFESFARAAKDNPDFFFQQFGIDPDQYSQARLAKKLELEMMDPRDRKLKEYEEREAKRAEEEKAQREKADKERLTKAEQEADRQLRMELMNAVKDAPLISDDPHMIARVAAMMAASEEQELGWTWADCVAKVDSEIRGALRSVVGRLDPEGIQALLGDEPLKKWREFDVKRVTGKAAQKSSASGSKGPGSSASKQQSTSTGSKKALSEEEYRDYFARLAKGE